MVEIKVDTDEILFRIVFAGRDRATKFATLRALQESFAADGGPMIVMHAGGDRVVGFGLPVAEEERLFGMKVRIEVLARPGPRQSPANDVLLHRSADAIVWLDDRDDDGDADCVAFGQFLDDLDRLGRKPRDLPIFVQCYADAGGGRRRAAFERKHGDWRPECRLVGEGARQVAEVFIEARNAVFGAYRRYEKELARAGLEDHVKIRDRVYERLPMMPEKGPISSRRDVRLIQSRGRVPDSRERLTTIILFVALGLAVAAAFLVARVV
ncbi:MAG: hypothetical protein H6807_07470 [Planctomycetes bacterium]|nr:hypothetical protein [Planctomycetota bacterium]